MPNPVMKRRVIAGAIAIPDFFEIIGSYSTKVTVKVGENPEFVLDIPVKVYESKEEFQASIAEMFEDINNAQLLEKADTVVEISAPTGAQGE